jgi:hypothetical protein
MATQIVISNNDSILIDDTFRIDWEDKGKNWDSSWLPTSIHYVVYNEAIGDNEIQNIDPSNGRMTGNTLLSSTSDIVGNTTLGDLLTWGETRRTQINSAQMDYDNARENATTRWVEDGNAIEDFGYWNSATSSYFDWSKSWRDYDEHYS